MNVSVDRSDLLRLLSLTAPVCDRKSPMPILGNVRLSAADGRVTASSTDLQTSVEAHGPCEGKPGAITMPARQLHALVRELPAGAVSLEVDGRRLVVRANGSTFKLPTLPAADYPALPSAPAEGQRIPARVLAELIDAAAYAMSADDTRPFLAGLLLDADGEIAIATASDSHRLARASAECAWLLTESILIPRRGVAELRKALDVNGVAIVAVADRHLHVSTDGCNVAVKLSDAKAPPYDQVIPTRGDRAAGVHREDLLGAIKRAALASPGDTGVGLTVAECSIVIRAESADAGEAVEQVIVDPGGDAECRINPAYLAEAVAALPGERVRLQVTGAMDPVMLWPDGDETRLSVVMPQK